MKDIIELTLLRHGRSKADDDQVHEGRLDSPLTEVGRGQVERRAQQWLSEGRTFDLAICSSLQRARQTAEIITQTLNIPLEISDAWQEHNKGLLTGVPFSVAKVQFPMPASRNPYLPVWEGESDWQVFCRATWALEQIVRRGPGRYLVVAHGGILNHALHNMMGTQPMINQAGFFIDFGDTGYAKILYSITKNTWVLKEFVSE